MKNVIVDECQLLEASSVPSKTYKAENPLPDGIRGSPEECGAECPDNGPEKVAQVPERHLSGASSADGPQCDDAARAAQSNDERNSRPVSTRLAARSSKRKYDEVAAVQEGRDVESAPRSVDGSTTRPDSPSIRNAEATDQSVEIARWKRPYEMESDTLQVMEAFLI